MLSKWSKRLLKWGLPSMEQHMQLVRHDQLHGDKPARLGWRFHWFRSWFLQKQRQVWQCDALVSGANPWLGALRAAGLARAGIQTIWVYHESPDQWDTALVARGMHKSALEEAGLPLEPKALFDYLAKECGSKLTMMWDQKVQYTQNSIAFLKPHNAELMGGSQHKISGFLRESFRTLSRGKFKKQPLRFGGQIRDGIVFYKHLMWVSDPSDGTPRLSEDQECRVHVDEAGQERWGSASWSSANPITFAKRSLEDTQNILKLGGWPDVK